VAVRAYRWVEDRIVRLLDYFERAPVTLGRALAILAAVFAFRNVFEALAAGAPLYYPAAFLVHFPLAYLPGIVLVPLVLAALSGERVERVTKVLVVAWALTVLPPLFELIAGHAGARISYLPIQPGRFWWSVANYFNPGVEFEGATAGVRLEGALGVILGGYYVYLKRKRVWIALASLPVIFLVMVNVFSLPYIFHHILRAFGSEVPHVAALFGTRGLVLRPVLDLSDYSTALLDLLYLTPLLALWLLVYGRKKLKEVARWAFRLDTGGYALAAGVGLWLGWRAVGAGLPLTNPLDWMAMLGVVLTVFHAALGIRMLLPKDSPGDKPVDVEKGPLTDRERRNVGAVCLLLAVGYAGTVNYYLLGTLAVFAAAQAFLHLRPLNLRRVWPLSGALIGASVVAALATGLAAFIGGAVTTALPGPLTWGVLAVSVLGAGVLELRSEALLGGLLKDKGRRVFAAVTASLGVFIVILLPQPLWSRIALAVLGIGLAVVLLAAGEKTPRYAYLVWPAAVAVVLWGRTSTGEEPFAFNDLPPNPVAVAALDEAADFERNNLYAHAALEYARAVETGDERARVLGPLAFNLRQTGRLAEAEAVLERSVALHPEHAPALVDLAAAKAALGKTAEGERLYRRALRLWPHLVQPRVALGWLALDRAAYFRGLGEDDPAKASLEEALRWAEGAYLLDPSSDSAAGLLATVYEERGDFAGAYKLWRKRAHASPLDPNARVALARLAREMGKDDEARGWLEEALELDPGYALPPGLQELLR
jgi:tetratricopeptide (TPR) repeat protein